MGLRDRMYELTTVEEFTEFLDKFPTSAIFKAGTCHKTMQGFGYVEQALDPYENIHMAFVRVVESRPVSNHIAQLTNIIHQSPQLILMIDKKPVYDVDNWNITPEALNVAILKHLGPVNSNSSKSHSNSNTTRSDVEPYINLLEGLIEGNINESEFERQWLKTFQLDANPRSTEQFNILNSLFGDVDHAISTHHLSIVNSNKQEIKGRAAQVLAALKAS